MNSDSPRRSWNPRMVCRALAISSCLIGLASSCSNEGPSKGNVSVSFPSTAAAVATDTLQFFVFDVPSGQDRTTYCDQLVGKKRSGDVLVPQMQSPEIPICQAFAKYPLPEISYGEHAIMAIGSRSTTSPVPRGPILIGCVVQTVDEGDVQTPIVLSLFDAAVTLPPDPGCSSLSEFCTPQSACAH